MSDQEWGGWFRMSCFFIKSPDRHWEWRQGRTRKQKQHHLAYDFNTGFCKAHLPKTTLSQAMASPLVVRVIFQNDEILHGGLLCSPCSEWQPLYKESVETGPVIRRDRRTTYSGKARRPETPVLAPLPRPCHPEEGRLLADWRISPRWGKLHLILFSAPKNRGRRQYPKPAIFRYHSPFFTDTH